MTDMSTGSCGTDAEISENIRYLRLLARQYRTIDEASTEIINLQAILNLPKGTEHFIADIHGESEPFEHVLRNASGVIRQKINENFGNSLTQADKKSLATLIYYPEQKLDIVLRSEPNIEDWYKITLYRLIEVCRCFSSKYTRSKVRKAMPENYRYILEELLHNEGDIPNQHEYYSEIIRTIIDIDRAREFIIALSKLIQRLAIDRLHIIGDTFDRGPGADRVMDTLLNYHDVDVQWGNHDILWMGASAGSDVCIANALRISARYANLEVVENGYGINLLPLATFAMEFYGDDPCECFRPKLDRTSDYSKKELHLIAQMHKAISIIQFKLEKPVIERHPEFGMNARLLLDKIDYASGTIDYGGKTLPLCDTRFPTVDPADPCRLSNEEKALIEKLRFSFVNSEKLARHTRFLFSNGSIYLACNSNLLYHGCVPLDENGGFRSVTFGGREYHGRALLDYFDVCARRAYFFNTGSAEREDALDTVWYLWTGPYSPLFGKDHMATFERYFIKDSKYHNETKDPYYSYRDSEKTCSMILSEFGLDPKCSHIINGHIPVEKKNGESPIKANGKLIVIDGGFSRSYQSVTGLAGYTLISNSHGLTLVSHEPFKSTEEAIRNESDILSSNEVLERAVYRTRVRDIDDGVVISQQIKELKLLLCAYRKGLIKESKRTNK
jgi:fructose-1,6-bisphosphatase-3